MDNAMEVQLENEEVCCTILVTEQELPHCRNCFRTPCTEMVVELETVNELGGLFMCRRYGALRQWKREDDGGVMLCRECLNYLKKDGLHWKFAWPACLWSLVNDQRGLGSTGGSSKIDAREVWAWIPESLRKSWLPSEHQMHRDIVEVIRSDPPSPVFEDFTLRKQQLNEDLESLELARLIGALNRHPVPQVR